VFAFDLNYFRFAHADSFRSGRIARSWMQNCNRWSGLAFDNFPFGHVISNFCPSYTSNLVEVQ
jgi:hypothetical protein